MTWLKCRRFLIFQRYFNKYAHTQIPYMLLDRVWPCQSLGSFPGWESRINFQTLYFQFTVICNSYSPLKVFVLLRCAVCFFAPNKTTSGRLVLSQKRERRVKSHKADKGCFCIFNFLFWTDKHVCLFLLTIWWLMEKVDLLKTHPIREENLHKHVVSLWRCKLVVQLKKLI